MPPVFDEVNIEVKNEKEDKQIYGIHISKGAHVKIEDLRIHVGEMSDDARLFESRNRILLEKGLINCAGEDLAIYTATDYVQGINSVISFVEKCFMREWDERLFQLLIKRN